MKHSERHRNCGSTYSWSKPEKAIRLALNLKLQVVVLSFDLRAF